MIPVVDLGDPTAVDAVVAACESSGFFVVTGHGMPTEVVDALHEQGRAFFALPLSERAALRAGPSTDHLGWTDARSESLAASLDQDTPPDLKEAFVVPHPVPWANRQLHDADPGDPPDVWPPMVPGLRPAALDYYSHMERLAARLMDVFALGLDLPAGFFREAIDRHISGFRVLHYPAVDSDPEPGQLRAGAHTDYGSLTVLSLDAGATGLQVRHRDGAWVDVPAVEGSFVVNVGDLMAQWTNDRWVSSLHRVVVPTGGDRHRSRQSIAFFHQPNADAIVEPLPTCCTPDHPARYAPVTSMEHLRSKLAKQRAVAQG